MILSSHNTRRTVYDRTPVMLSGVVIPCSIFPRSELFLREFLEFKVVNSKTPSADLPGGKQVTCALSSPSEPIHPATIVLRIRGNYSKMREHFFKKLKAPLFAQLAGSNSSLAVGEIIETPTGHEFSVVDPDGNTFIFFKPPTLAGQSTYVPR